MKYVQIQQQQNTLKLKYKNICEFKCNNICNKNKNEVQNMCIYKYNNMCDPCNCAFWNYSTNDEQKEKPQTPVFWFMGPYVR